LKTIITLIIAALLSGSTPTVNAPQPASYRAPATAQPAAPLASCWRGVPFVYRAGQQRCWRGVPFVLPSAQAVRP
jgi:hypothetical protein